MSLNFPVMNLSQTLPCIRKDLSVSECAEEIIVYDETAKKIHVLNCTAAIIFRLSDGTRTVGDVVDYFSNNFELPPPPATIVTDLMVILSDFCEKRFYVEPN